MAINVFAQGMYELPDDMNNRFIFYLNVLPIVQEAGIYLAFFTGAICLIWSVVMILLYQPKGSQQQGQWFENEMQRKRLNFLNERQASFNKNKEMDTYYNSLLSPEEPLTSIKLEDLPDLKEEVV